VLSEQFKTRGKEIVSQRPLGVAILAVLDVISGLLILTLGALFIILNWSITQGGLSGPSGVLSTLLLVWAMVIVIIGFLYLAVASGLWNGSGWAWTLCIVFSIIGIIIGLFFSFLELQSGIIIMLINIVALVYLNTGNVRAYFGKERGSNEEEPSGESNWDKPSTR
jgi:hypothetical protein